MATGTDLIVRGLTMIGEKALGASLSATEQTHWLAVFNAMLDSLSLDRLMVYQLLQESKALSASVGSYTIGSGGAWDTTRPNKIVDPCFVRDSNGQDYPVELIDAAQYGLLVKKTLESTYPEYLFYDHAYASSLGTIYLYPEPAATGYTLYINSWKQLTRLSTIGDTVTLPPGYEEMLTAQFAIRAAAGQVPVSAELARIARDSKAAVARLNAPSPVLQMDAGVSGRRRWNINTDA